MWINLEDGAGKLFLIVTISGKQLVLRYIKQDLKIFQVVLGSFISILHFHVNFVQHQTIPLILNS